MHLGKCQGISSNHIFKGDFWGPKPCSLGWYKASWKPHIGEGAIRSILRNSCLAWTAMQSSQISAAAVRLGSRQQTSLDRGRWPGPKYRCAVLGPEERSLSSGHTGSPSDLLELWRLVRLPPWRAWLPDMALCQTEQWEPLTHTYTHSLSPCGLHCSICWVLLSCSVASYSLRSHRL